MNAVLYVILYSSKILKQKNKFSTKNTVFNIHNEKKWLLKSHFAITEIIFKYITIKYFTILPFFYCIFDQINAALGSKETSFENINKSYQGQTFEQ